MDRKRENKLVNHPNRGRGRPPIDPAKRKVRQNMNLSPDVLEALKAKGPGWMPAADDMLRRALEAEGAL